MKHPKKSKVKTSKTFWEKEYKQATHLKMSSEPAEDLLTFVKWAQRNAEWNPFPKGGFILDIGCGNGRNIINMAEEFSMMGLGIDISAEAIEQAKNTAKSKKIPLDFSAKAVEGKIDLPDQSVDIVLDMMTTHFLTNEQRTVLAGEIKRVMKPYGWFFFKTFILDGDSHAKRLLRDNPADDSGSYIHPRIKVAEHVFTDEEIGTLFCPEFKIHKMLKSYKHVLDGKAHKRRTVSVYMERMRD